jgi:hypothetical protein
MRSLLSKAVLAAAFMGLAIGGATRAQSGDNDGCSNATLKGDYAFTVSGWFTAVVNGVPVTVQRLGVAMTKFDGMGGLQQVDFVASSVPPPGTPAGAPPNQWPTVPTDGVTGFHTEETGTYTVHSDCTGTFTINFPKFSNGIPGAVIVTKFVLADHGRSIYTVVTSLTPPGAPAALPPTAVFISSQGHKLGRVGEE